MTEPIVVRTDLPLRARYSEGAGAYRIIPQAVVRPQQFPELQAVMTRARAAGWHLVPRGAGSAMDGSNVGAGVVVDLTGYEADRCDIDAETRRAFVSPAVSCRSINNAARPAGLRLPPDPSSSAFATIGGMLSTNASGARSVRYGSVRRWVDTLMLLTPDGPLDLARGRPLETDHPVSVRWRHTAEPLIRRHAATIRARYPRVSKNSAGYALDQYLASDDLIDIVIGSEGTLGFITDIGLRLDAIPAQRGSLRVALRSRHDLVPALEAIRSQDPSTLEFMDRSFLRFVADVVNTPERPGLLHEAGGLLLADIESDDFDDMWQRGAAAVRAVGALALDARLAIDEAEIDRLWAVRHGASPRLAGLTDGRRSLQLIEDGCVPVARLVDYLDAVDAACAAEGVDVVMFGHAGDGHVHVNLLPDVSRAGLARTGGADLRPGQRCGDRPGRHTVGRARRRPPPRRAAGAALRPRSAGVLPGRQARLRPRGNVQSGGDPLRRPRSARPAQDRLRRRAAAAGRRRVSPRGRGGRHLGRASLLLISSPTQPWHAPVS